MIKYYYSVIIGNNYNHSNQCENQSDKYCIIRRNGNRESVDTCWIQKYNIIDINCNYNKWI